MASITDCVVEGLKYPFNDIKKLLGFGVFFAVFELLSIVFTMNTVDMFRIITDTLEKTNVTASDLKFAMLPESNVYMAIGIIIVGFIVALFIMGYQYNVISFSINKKEDLPGFGDILAMFVNGVRYFIVSLAYSIPPMLVMILGMMLLGDSSVMPVIILISFLLLAICYFLLIMALNNMIAHDSIKKAFDFGEITGNISNLGWGKYIGTILFTLVVFMIVNIAVGVILSFLTVIFAAAINNQAFAVSTFITLVEALFVSSYCSVFFNRVCGSVYRESVK